MPSKYVFYLASTTRDNSVKIQITFILKLLTKKTLGTNEVPALAQKPYFQPKRSKMNSYSIVQGNGGVAVQTFNLVMAAALRSMALRPRQYYKSMALPLEYF